MNRGNIDQPAAFALLNHLAGCSLRDEKRPDEIDVENFLKFFERIIYEGDFLLDAGVVDDDVQLAECLDGFVNEVFDLIRLRDIGGNGQAPSAEAGNFFFRVGGNSGVADIVDDYRGAFAGEPDGDCFADAGCGARHDSYLAL